MNRSVSEPAASGPSILSAGSIDGWRVEVRWWAEDATELSDGPREVNIRLEEEASPAVRAKGFNSGVMRRVETLIRQLVDEVHASDDGMAEKDVYLAAVAQRVRDLPERGARSHTGDYYGGLLALYEEIAVVSDEPGSILAAAMNIPRSTLNSQVKRARSLRASKSAQRAMRSARGDHG